VVILFRAELKLLLYLKLKEYPIVEVDENNPDPTNNYCLVGAKGQLTV